MGGKFSENPDPPCVHCGEDQAELMQLRERVAKLELENFDLRVKVDNPKCDNCGSGYICDNCDRG